MDVLTDRFFIFRIFLFGESARSTPGRIGNELEKLSLWFFSSIMPRPGTELVLRFLNDVYGRRDSGDSGGELGEGSVREDSIVEMVVVGEDSTDSKVDVESRRIIDDAKVFGILENLMVDPDASVDIGLLLLDSSLSGPFPNTDMNEGIDASSDCELVETGILESPAVKGELLFMGLKCCCGEYATSTPREAFVG